MRRHWGWTASWLLGKTDTADAMLAGMPQRFSSVPPVGQAEQAREEARQRLRTPCFETWTPDEELRRPVHRLSHMLSSTHLLGKISPFTMLKVRLLKSATRTRELGNHQKRLICERVGGCSA